MIDEWHPKWWNKDKPYANVWWRKQRARYFSNPDNVFCKICLLLDRQTIATELDHKKPFKGSWILFSDYNNWQGLCKSCHSATKRMQENHGYSQACGVDGIPLDSGHPWNKGRQ